MKRVLVVYFSQTGQLKAVVRRFTAPLEARSDVCLDCIALEPVAPYPFPWPILRFFDLFPECVYLDAPPITLVIPEDSYDLIIIAYQVWFLSPSLPITAFLKSDIARRLLGGKPVITLIACRNMWIIAQEKMKSLLKSVGARLIDNVVLTDRAGLSTFITTPYWLLTGRKHGLWVLPPAGIAHADIEACDRFGHAVAMALEANAERASEPMLAGLRAVEVDPRLIAMEHLGHRSFLIWGRLLRAIGPAGSTRRVPFVLLYAAFLALAILTVVPASMFLRALLRPLWARRLAAEKTYFERPSGSSTERMVP